MKDHLNKLVVLLLSKARDEGDGGIHHDVRGHEDLLLLDFAAGPLFVSRLLQLLCSEADKNLNEVFVVLEGCSVFTTGVLLVDDLLPFGFVYRRVRALGEKTFALRAPRLLVVGVRSLGSTLGFAIIT